MRHGWRTSWPILVLVLVFVLVRGIGGGPLFAQGGPELGFEAPERIVGTAGESARTDEVWAVLRRGEGDERSPGVGAWSIGIRIDGAAIEDAGLPASLPASDVSFERTEILESGAVVSTVVLGSGSLEPEGSWTPRLLDPDEGPHRILRLALRCPVPGGCTSARLRYVDGLRASDARPVENLVTVVDPEDPPEVATVRPEPVSREIRVEPAGGCDPAARAPFLLARLVGPERVDAPPGSDVEMEVSLRIEPGEIPLGRDLSRIDGWSFGVETEGCEIVSLRLPPEIEALRPILAVESPLGASASVSAVAFDPREGGGPRLADGSLELLRISLRAVAGGRCREARIRLVDGLAPAGRPVECLIVSSQAGYRPSRLPLRVALGPSEGCPTGTDRPLALRLDGPASVAFRPGEPAEIPVVARLAGRVESEDGIRPSVEAWSLALRANGCDFVAAETARWVSALDDAFEETRISAEGDVATSAVVLGLGAPRAVELAPGGTEAARLLLRSAAGGADCPSCDVRFEDGVAIDRHPIDNLAVVGQQGYSPELDTLGVRLLEEALCPVSAELPLDEEVVVTSCSPDVCRAIDVAAGESFVVDVTLHGAGADSELELLSRWDEPASPAAHDRRGTRAGQRTWRIAGRATRSATLHLLARARLGSGDDAATLRMSAFASRLALEGLTPDLGAIEGRAGVRVTGAGFEPGVTRFFLVAGDGSSWEARDVVVLSDSEADVRFDLALRGLRLGEYGVEARGRDGVEPARLEDAFRIVTAPEAFGVEVHLTGPDRYRRGRSTLLSLRYENLEAVDRAAPWILVTAPEGTRLRLTGPRDLRERRLMLLASDPGGFAGSLGPGVEGSVAIVVESEQGSGADDVAYEVSLVTPLSGDRVDWDAILAPLDSPLRGDLRSALPGRLGETWTEVQAAIAERADRLGRRGATVADLDALLRHAAREALGEPVDAIAGRVVDAETGRPIAGALLVALPVDGDEPISSARSDDTGRFALTGLRGGVERRVRVSGRDGETVVPAATWRDGSDLLGLRIPASRAPGPEYPEACPSCELALEELRMPVPTAEGSGTVELTTPISDWASRVAGPIDPNDKTAPDGEGKEVFGVGKVPPTAPIVYTIWFENLPGADYAAQTVDITDRLDPDLDPLSVRFHSAGFGLATEPIPLGDARLYAAASRPFVHEESGREYRVTLRAHVALETGVVHWRFETEDPLDPAGVLPEDVGFLPANDPETGVGEGRVVFSATPKKSTKDQEIVENRARIRFDSEAIFLTGEVRHQVDHFLAPGTPDHPVPASGSTVEPGGGFRWERDPNVAWYDLVYEREGDSPRVVRDLRTASFRPPEGLRPGSYRWRVTARNIRDVRTAGAEWTVRVETPVTTEARMRRGDANADGRINITDAVSILRYLFSGGEAPACPDAADVDDDEVLNISDAIQTLNYLFLGGAPPRPPSEECGEDPSGDRLGCPSFPPCE